MDPGTGRIYELPVGFMPEAVFGDTFERVQIAAEMERLQAEARRRGLDLLEAERLTLVSPEVAQRMKLGAREQARRRSRRKISKRSKQRNR